jgi:hypothetical protein
MQGTKESLTEKYNNLATYTGSQIDASSGQTSSIINLLNTDAMCLDSEKIE